MKETIKIVAIMGSPKGKGHGYTVVKDTAHHASYDKRLPARRREVATIKNI